MYTPTVVVGVTRNFCGSLLLQVDCCRNAPWAVDPPVTARHLSLCTAFRWTVPPPASTACHFWLLPPVAGHWTIWALSAVEASLTSMNLPLCCAATVQVRPATPPPPPLPGSPTPLPPKVSESRSNQLFEVPLNTR